jgi:hypothetical protein
MYQGAEPALWVYGEAYSGPAPGGAGLWGRDTIGDIEIVVS